MASLWAPDGSYDVGDWTMSNRDDISAMVKSDAHQGLMARGCCHFFGPPVVTVDGDTARAACQSASWFAARRAAITSCAPGCI